MNLSTTNAGATASNKYKNAGGHKNILETHIYPIRVIIKLKDLLKILAWKLYCKEKEKNNICVILASILGSTGAMLMRSEGCVCSLVFIIGETMNIWKD